LKNFHRQGAEGAKIESFCFFEKARKSKKTPLLHER